MATEKKLANLAPPPSAAASEEPKPAPPQFALPVDSEMKAKTIRIHSLARPHMRAFHLAWFGFFLAFLATFAPSALLPVIRENLNLDKVQIGTSGVASVCGDVVMRFFLGTLLDTVGPRLGAAMTLLLVAPGVFCISLVTDSASYIAVRLIIGLSLSLFVCCQYWVGSMFNVRIVGTANAIAAGWGNAGGGACALIMPLIYEGIIQYVPGFQAWRWAFFVPGGLYVLTGITILLTGLDLPNGDVRDLKKSGQMAKGKGQVWAVIKCALGNYRTWVLALTYGYCYGIELSVDHIIVSYLYDQFEMPIITAGGIGALFGLMNVFTRASGGVISDLLAVRFGMRGRLWALWVLQTLGGVFCLIMGRMDNTLAGTIATMLVFALFCQQACGATSAIVPFVSRRAYGLVSGCFAAGGNVGSIVTQTIFFAGSVNSPALSTQEGLVWMGVMTMGVTLFVSTLHWPMWGGMFSKGDEDYPEENYYLKEWSPEEIAQGLHCGSMKFAMESRSQRGYRATGQVPAAVLNASLKSNRSANDASVTLTQDAVAAKPV